MTLEEYNNSLRSLAERTEDRLTERVIVIAATRLLASMHNRIFRDGQDSAGSRIGAYSRKPIYVTKEQFVKKSAFKPIGKGGYKGEKVVDTYRLNRYNPRLKQFSRTPTKTIVRVSLTSMYLKEGYKEFRDIQGRPTAEVNLQLRGDLKLSFTLQAKDKEVLIGFNDELQVKKRKSLEKHFKGTTGTIFPATEEEKQLYAREVMGELRLVEQELMNTFS